MGSQVVGEDQTRFSGRGTLGKLVVEEDDKEEPAKERRGKYTNLGLDLGERKKQVACHASAMALTMTDEVCREVEIFIASIGRRKSLMSFTNCFFHFRRPPELRFAFDAAEGNKKFGRIQYQRSTECNKSGKRRVFLCRTTVRVEVKGKVILKSFLKIEARWTFVGAKHERNRES